MFRLQYDEYVKLYWWVFDKWMQYITMKAHNDPWVHYYEHNKFTQLKEKFHNDYMC